MVNSEFYCFTDLSTSKQKKFLNSHGQYEGSHLPTDATLNHLVTAKLSQV